MDLPVLKKIAEELNQELAGGFMNKTHQPLPREIVLRIRGQWSGEKKLVISADPQLGRVHLTELKIPNPPAPPRFCAFLRAHLQGARIEAISCLPDDRVISISAGRGPADQRSKMLLILELLGRDSNIVLVDKATSKIMDCLHHIGEKESSTRLMLPGLEYQPPPTNPNLQRPSENHGAEPFKPGIVTDQRSRRRLVADVGSAQDNVEAFPTMNAAADRFYGEKLKSLLLESYRRAVAAPLVSRTKSLDRRLTKIKADSQRLEIYVRMQDDGELIKANLYRIKKGMSSIEVEDWVGEKRVVKLDPKLDPIGNMNHIFKRGAKGKRGQKIVEERLETTAEEKRAIEDLLYFVETAANVEDLDSLNAELLSANHTAKKSRVREQEKPTEPFLRFTAPSGATVLVGKSGRGNDALIRSKASKHDLWFHAKDYSGAHVVLSSQKGPPTPEDIDFAASLAVDHSKAGGKGKVEVIVATVGDLSRAKGAHPGQVKVRKFKTVLSEGGWADAPVERPPS
jgi:predicted ribosome quality control (RQC) complex YloA/Tae2 family protein